MSTVITKHAAIVLEDHRVLLVREKGQDYFKNLGGKQEKNESPEQCLAREVNEEIGVRITDTEFYYKVPRTRAVGDPTKELDIYLYLVEIVGNPVLKNEIEEIIYLGKDDYLNKRYKITYQLEGYIIPKLIEDGLVV